MAASFPFDDLPAELWMEILSLLSWRQQVGIRRVSRRWLAAVDACLARRRELDIAEEDVHRASFDALILLSPLQSMPALRRLCIISRPTKKKACYNRAYVSGVDDIEHGLPMSRLDVRKLCVSCPHLEEVVLDCELDETGVETLLRRLPGLRSLHLEGAKAEGRWLSLLPTSLQCLRLPWTRPMKLADYRHFSRCPQLRELDLSRIEVTDDQLATVLSACPLLERLSVIACPRLSALSLPNVARCTLLRDLDVSGLGDEYNPGPSPDLCDMSGVLNSCRRLKRLRLAYTREWLSEGAVVTPTGITHLDLSHTWMMDYTFSRVSELMPNVRDLRLSGCSHLSSRGLARGLVLLTNLQVLDISHLDRDIHRILYFISRLPLRALAFTWLRDGGATTGARMVAALLRRCVTLSLLSIVRISPQLARAIHKELTRKNPAVRQVTLMVDSCAVRPLTLPAKLPDNYRVLERRYDVWKQLSGWP